MFRRILMMVPLVLLAATALTVPAQAAEPEVEMTVSPATAKPGENVTVAVKLINRNGFSILQPRARLFGTPRDLSSYTTLAGCTGAASCTAIPGGYQGALAEALGGFQSATVTFTLTVQQEALGGTDTLRGQLFGGNYASEIADGPQLTIDTKADLAVDIKGTPRPGLLNGRIDFVVTVANVGPNRLVAGTVTTTMPGPITATNTSCAAVQGQVSCPVTDLAPGAMAKSTFSVPFGLLTIGLPLQFRAARAGSNPVDPNAANDKASTTCTVVTPLLVSCR